MRENDMLGMDFVSSVTKMDTCRASAQLRRKEDRRGRTRDAIRGKGRRRSNSHLAVISEQRIWTAGSASSDEEAEESQPSNEEVQIRALLKKLPKDQRMDMLVSLEQDF